MSVDLELIMHGHEAVLEVVDRFDGEVPRVGEYVWVDSELRRVVAVVHAPYEHSVAVYVTHETFMGEEHPGKRAEDTAETTLSAQAKADIEAARADIEAGRTTPLEDVEEGLDGVSPDDFHPRNTETDMEAEQ